MGELVFGNFWTYLLFVAYVLQRGELDVGNFGVHSLQVEPGWRDGEVIF